MYQGSQKGKKKNKNIDVTTADCKKKGLKLPTIRHGEAWRGRGGIYHILILDIDTRWG
jgi:hypothetical protein